MPAGKNCLEIRIANNHEKKTLEKKCKLSHTHSHLQALTHLQPPSKDKILMLMTMTIAHDMPDKWLRCALSLSAIEMYLLCLLAQFLCIVQSRKENKHHSNTLSMIIVAVVVVASVLIVKRQRNDSQTAYAFVRVFTCALGWCAYAILCVCAWVPTTTTHYGKYFMRWRR